MATRSTLAGDHLGKLVYVGTRAQEFHFDKDWFSPVWLSPDRRFEDAAATGLHAFVSSAPKSGALAGVELAEIVIGGAVTEPAFDSQSLKLER